MPKVRACIKEDGGKVALAELELPGPGPGQALIRTELTTICGSDIHVVHDIDAIPAGTPMGHEAVGVVEAIGDGVERFRPGDRVVTACLYSCGRCDRCSEGEFSVCATFGAPMNLLFGAQGDAYLIPGADYSMARIPAGMDARHALFASDILSTGFAAMERGGLRKGQTVAIFAQGPVGLCATAAARHYGAETIVAVESVPARVAMAERMGATHVIDPVDAVSRIRELTGGIGVDLAVEALGRQETLDNCFAAARFGGTVSSVGVYGGLERVSIPTDGSFYHRRFVTTLCPTGTERLQFLLGLIESGSIDMTPLFTHTMPLADIVKAYDLFTSRRDGVIKIAIE